MVFLGFTARVALTPLLHTDSWSMLPLTCFSDACNRDSKGLESNSFDSRMGDHPTIRRSYLFCALQISTIIPILFTTRNDHTQQSKSCFGYVQLAYVRKSVSYMPRADIVILPRQYRLPDRYRAWGASASKAQLF